LSIAFSMSNGFPGSAVAGTVSKSIEDFLAEPRWFMRIKSGPAPGEYAPPISTLAFWMKIFVFGVM